MLLDVICSGQKDSIGQPDPLVFAELEMLILVINAHKQKQRVTPKKLLL